MQEQEQEEQGKEEFIGKGWDVGSEEAAKGQRYVSLKGGEKLLLNPMGQVEVFKKAFKNQQTGEWGEPQTRYRIEIFCPESGTAKEWDFGVGLFKDLRRASELQGNAFSDAVFELAREGEGKTGTKWHLNYARQLEDGEAVARNNLITPDLTDKQEADIPF